MMDGLYGKITKEQLNDFKNRLHSKIHWLLIYKESDEFDVNYDAYYTELMNYIGKAGEVLRQDAIVLEILTELSMAYGETVKDEFNHKRYRHYVLEAHNLVDCLGVSE